MEMPLVSIIVPVYNAQSHLSRCLESICGQEYKNLELIVINDGSKDKSLPVCEEFRKKDSRILLVDKANSGVSDTRNLGLKLASGKYVQFVDSDDYIDPDFTKHLVEAAEAHHADLVIAPYKMVIPAGATKPEQVLEKLEDFHEQSIHDALFQLIQQLGVKNGYLLWPVRVAVSGKALTPGGGIEICAMLGKEESLRRIRKGIQQLKDAQA